MSRRSASPSMATFIGQFPDDAVVRDPLQLDLLADVDGAARPLAAVFPQSTAQVQTVMRWASQEHVPVVVRGAGSRLARTGVDFADAVILCTRRMHAVSVDSQRRQVTAGAGVRTLSVLREAAVHGLGCGFEPAVDESTIAGDVSMNGHGMTGGHPGPIRDDVRSMQVVLADGTNMRIDGEVGGRLALAGLFAGSAGMFGVITEVTLRLAPQPVDTVSVLAGFDRDEAAADAALEIAASARPAVLELVSRTVGGPFESGRAALVASCDAQPGDDVGAAEQQAARIAAICTSMGAVATLAHGPRAVAPMMAARRRAQTEASRLGRTTARPLSMPATRLPEYLGLVTELAGRLHVEPRVFANVSKGLVQVCVLPNGSRAHLDDALAALVDVAERLRREATGVRRDPSTAPGWFEPEPGESSALTPEGMKFALDPHNLLNPGLAV